MKSILPTVRVVNEKAKNGFMIINESDYDEAVHKLFDVVTPETAEAEKKKVEKVKIVAETQKGYKLINKSDFDESKHTLYVEQQG